MCACQAVAVCQSHASGQRCGGHMTNLSEEAVTVHSCGAEGLVLVYFGIWSNVKLDGVVRCRRLLHACRLLPTTRLGTTQTGYAMHPATKQPYCSSLGCAIEEGREAAERFTSRIQTVRPSVCKPLADPCSDIYCGSPILARLFSFAHTLICQPRCWLWLSHPLHKVHGYLWYAVFSTFGMWVICIRIWRRPSHGRVYCPIGIGVTAIAFVAALSNAFAPLNVQLARWKVAPSGPVPLTR